MRASLFSLGSSSLLELGQVLFQVGYPLADSSSVHLQLGFTGTSCADTAGKAGQRRTFTKQAGKEISELGQFDLDFPPTAPGVPGENVEDEHSPVDDLQLCLVSDRPQLRRSQFAVEDEGVYPLVQSSHRNIPQLALTHNVSWIRS